MDMTEIFSQSISMNTTFTSSASLLKKLGKELKPDQRRSFYQIKRVKVVKKTVIKEAKLERKRR